MAADYYCETLNPRDPKGPKAKILFPGCFTEKLYKTAPVDYENLRAAKFVLENVRRIFFGLRRFTEGGWCYTGRPEEWCVRPDVTATFPSNRVFAVYVNSRLHVFQCRAEYADENDRDCPRNWESRYRGLIWKNTS